MGDTLTHGSRMYQRLLIFAVSVPRPRFVTRLREVAFVLMSVFSWFAYGAVAVRNLAAGERPILAPHHVGLKIVFFLIKVAAASFRIDFGIKYSRSLIPNADKVSRYSIRLLFLVKVSKNPMSCILRNTAGLRSLMLKLTSIAVGRLVLLQPNSSFPRLIDISVIIPHGTANLPLQYALMMNGEVYMLSPTDLGRAAANNIRSGM